MTIPKLVLLSGGVGVSVATAGAVAFYLTSGETIVEHLSKQSNLKNKKFISLVSDAQAHLEKKYSLSQENKPIKDGKAITKIVEWCKESENIKFSTESDLNYKLIEKWCFVNFNSLAQEAKSKDKVYVSDKDKDDEEWKTAWDTYNSEKTKSNLEINDADFIKADAKVQGGPALHKWCKAQDNKKMYEENSEETYKRYEKWCFKPK